MPNFSQTLLARTPPLLPSAVFDASLTPDIDASSVSDFVKIGWFLFNDDLPRAHSLAQRHEGDPTADYFYAIIHRREGDFSNAKYWFRRASSHPVLSEIYGDDPRAAGEFVDKCAKVGTGKDDILETAQREELARLTAWAQENA